LSGGQAGRLGCPPPVPAMESNDGAPPKQGGGAPDNCLADVEAAFLIALGLLAYTYAGYFLLVCLLTVFIKKRHRSEDTYRPFVSMVISLHNEEKLIAQRMDNFEALDYPADRCELLLGDDCSTDRTRAMIQERLARNPRIRFFPFDTHQGKTAVINTLVPQAKGTILAFTDANTFYAPDALRKMCRHYADPKIGSVSGRLILRSATGVNTDDSYWKFETLLKRREGDLGIVLGANGGIYSMRKELFRPLKSDVIQIDDFIWPVSVYLHGYRGVYEPEAIAHEEAAPDVEAEFRRKVRIGTGDYRALVECRHLLLPWKGWIAFAFWSHKVLRWFAPFLLIIVFVTSAFVAPWFFYVQSGLYALAAAGKLVSKQKHLLAKLLRVPYYFVGSNVALLIGFYKCVTGRQTATWTQKAHRAA
jgi:cellulose synthase/poly-beta-1,6-N-acetylglucosamine synthase-like glycosyltransferase